LVRRVEGGSYYGSDAGSARRPISGRRRSNWGCDGAALVYVRCAPIPAEDILYKGVHRALLPLQSVAVVVLSVTTLSTVSRPAPSAASALLQTEGLSHPFPVDVTPSAEASFTAHACARYIIAYCVWACHRSLARILGWQFSSIQENPRATRIVVSVWVGGVWLLREMTYTQIHTSRYQLRVGRGIN